MHRPASPLTVSSLFPEQLSHHLTQVTAFRDAVAVPPVGAGDVVLLSERGACANGDCFFSNVEVKETWYVSLSTLFCESFFEPSDPKHVSVHL